MKHFQLAAMLLLVSFAACKKDDQQQPDPVQPGAAKKLIKFSYQGVDIAPLELEYDAKGRVIRMNDGEDASTVSYSGNQVQIKEIRETENREVFNFTGKLNSNGWVTEGNGVSSYNGIPRNVQYVFEYDAAGYMTRKTANYNQGESIYDYHYTYKNGDMATMDVFVNGVYDYGGAWEYDENTQDRNGLNWEHLNVASTFTGKTNKHLATKYTGFRDGKVSWYANYVYGFDANGYPTSNAVSISNGNVYTVYYQYQ